MLAEFEEKQYEQHLNIALLHDKRLIYPPGQVLEGYLGFDVALFTRHPKFWTHFPHHYEEYFWLLRKLPKGIRLPREIWKTIEHLLEDMPPFKFNAFIQHKRPEYMSVSRAAEWSTWRKPYFRYKLLKHQQEALSKLESVIGKKGVVVYACPSFHTIKEFWDAVINNEVIEKSNFCQAGKLDNHSVFTFCDPGNRGVAHSEPEAIESYHFINRLEELEQIEPSGNNIQHIVNLSNTIHSLSSEGLSISRLYTGIVNHLTEQAEGGELSIAFSKISAFTFVTNTQYVVGY